MKKYIKNGMIAVDIGANIGSYTVLLSKLVGKTGKVYAFEPDKINFRRLKENVKGRKNIIVRKLAVGDTNGAIYLHISEELNIDHRTYETGENRRIEKIKCITLDRFFKTGQKIDFIKIDIQGFDFFAIKGASNTIRGQKKILIIGEFWPWGLSKAGVSPQEYIKLLKKLGLKITLRIPKLTDKTLGEKNFYTDFTASK